MISEQDKERIRSEMEYRELVTREIEQTKPGKPSRRITVILGHPFTITVIGGLLIAIIGAFLGDKHATHQQTLLWQQQQFDKKYTLLTNFSEPFKKYMVLLYNHRLSQAFLQGSADRDFLGRDKAEVKELYDRIVAELATQRKGAVVLASVRALFHSDTVLTIVEDLDRLVLSLQKDYPLTENQIDAMADKIEIKWRALILAMKDEIEQDKRMKVGD